MPIDYLAQRRAAENALTNTIQGRNIDDELAKTSADVAKSRDSFFGKLDPTVSAYTVGGTGVDRKRIPEIDRKSQATISAQRRTLTNQKYNAIFNNAMDLATRRGMDTASANAYARQIADQNTQMDFLAGEAQKKRDSKVRMNDVANEYAQRGVSLENQYQPNIDYGAALTRVLLGTGVNVATWNYLNKNSKTPTQQPTYSQNPNYTNPTDPNSQIYTGVSEDTNV